MLAIPGVLALVIAGLLKFLGHHASAVSWLVIIGGILIGCAVISYLRGWRDPLTRSHV
jgi:membrane protein DedA with SNARE-associated domain